MKKIIFTLLIVVLCYNTVFSFDTVSTKYFPLKIGNSWTYLFWRFFPQALYRIKYSVISSAVYNGHIYYKLSIKYQNPTGYIDSVVYRIDSLNGRLMQRSNECQESPFEVLQDSLSAHKNDSSILYCQFGGITRSVCIHDTIHFTGFGLNKISKGFGHDGFEYGEGSYYAKDIGIYYFSSSSIYGGADRTLIGCVIDGIVYSDTTLIGVNQISTQVPKSFDLYQNYPNPFNPSTKIKFSLPSERSPSDNPSEGGMMDVKLVIYDALGREVSVLVDEQLKPGTYEVEWNADGYSSGIYFYTLTVLQGGSSTGDFTATRKMVLMK